MSLSTALLWLLLMCLGVLYILVMTPDGETNLIEGNSVFTVTILAITGLAITGLAIALATILSGVA